MRSSDDILNASDYAQSDIAIIGMALRVPGARNVGEFWDNLRNGVSSIRRMSHEELLAEGESPARLGDPHYVPVTADLPDMEMFDADFFGLSPKEAAIMDPQHRHFLECSWEALENGARMPEHVGGPTGVFAGCGMGSYFYFNVCSHRELVDQTGMFLLRHTGNDKDFLATRASFQFDLQGPSINVQTACSTSLVAIHQACQSLLSRECDMALAGGVTIELPHRRGYVFQEGEILSPDGVCRAFDHRSAGTVFGSGVGVVVLRRLEDAIADGDPIQGVIKATAINNDGRDKAGYLAPSVDGQAKVIVEAHALAGIGADTIQYVECHGTGTRIGDPIEIEALTQAFRQSTEETGFCHVGSVKTNIGHTDTAAGVIGVIKAVLAVQNGEIPPSLGYEKPNPAIDFAASPFKVADRLIAWPQIDGPRRAAINSLGVGGTNAHAVVQEAPRFAEKPRREISTAPELIILSAKSRKALDDVGMALAAELQSQPQMRLDDVAHTLFSGRRAFEQRRIIAARDRADAIRLLAGGDAKRVHTHQPIEASSGAVFLFPGGGAQHPGMARALYEGEAGVRADIDEGLSYLSTEAAAEIRALWFDAGSEDAAKRFLKPSLQLPAILIAEVAVARHWIANGVRPSALIGHSMGENTAACISGVISFRDAVRLVRLRGELFDTIPAGGMLSVPLNEADLRKRLPAELDMASVNGPELCVVSGSDADLQAFQAALAADDIDAVRVAIDIAAHSRALDPILPRFEAFLRSITLHAPQIPILSNRSGIWLTETEARDPLYWVGHLRSTVDFAKGLATLAADRSRIYIEVGPGKTLSSLVKIQGTIDNNAVLNSLPHAEDTGTDDRTHMLGALGRAWALGLPVDLASRWPAAEQERLSLPAYAFQHQRYFLDRVVNHEIEGSAIPARHTDMADWGYRPSWRQQAAVLDIDQPDQQRQWLVFVDDIGAGEAVVARLRASGNIVSTIKVGDQFLRHEAGDYALCPEDGRIGYDALIKALAADGRMPERILHMWLFTGDESARPGSSFFHRNMERGFHALLHLGQALGEQTLPAPIHITVVSNGMQRVGDRALRHPEKSTVLGPVRVLPKELPGVTVRSIDIDVPTMPAGGRSNRLPARVEQQVIAARHATLNLLMDDLHGEPANETVAYEAGRRWVQRSVPSPLPQVAVLEDGFREHGIYFLTGGTGDIATIVAEALATRLKARLALFSRTRLPDRPFWPAYLRMHSTGDRVARAIQTIRKLESLGAEVLPLHGDVTNPEDVQRAINQTKLVFGGIDGVLHTAGVVHDDLIQLKSAAEVEAVLAPKVLGTVNLDQALAGEKIDLMVLFSSTSVETAPAGQVDYVAANAFLSAYAASQADRTDRRTIAVHWGIWSEIGLAARAVSGEAPREEKRLDAASGKLFTHWVEDGQGQRWLEAEVGPETHWVLNEHRLATGEAIWPGTGYIELASQAAREYGFDFALELNDLVFLRPLYVANGGMRRVRARLTPVATGYQFEVQSVGMEPDAGFGLHAEALLTHAAEGAAGPLDIADLRQRCAVEIADENGAAIRSAQEAHLAFGPRWKVLRSVRGNDGERFAELALDDRFAADIAAGTLIHPALLDIATGYAMDLIAGYEPGAALWAPLSYGRIRLHAPLTAAVVSRARLSSGKATNGFASFDITIADRDGRVLVEVERFTVRRLAAGTSLAPAAEANAGSGSDKARAASPAAAALSAQVVQGIRPSEGATALFRAVAAGRSEIIVSSMDLPALERLAWSRAEQTASSASFERPELETNFVAPESDLEIALAGFWTELLGIAKIGTQDSFFDLGGHSLIAVRLFRMIRQQLGVDLPISTLFEAPTISQCAALIAERGGTAPKSGDEPVEQIAAENPAGATDAPRLVHLVPMADGRKSGNAPFFLCAGMFGNILNLRHLALQIGADRPVYGLQARGVYAEHAPHETFEEMARDNIAELRSIQPHGPYHLGGFSGGGLVALEMALQLNAEGEEVATLIFLDTPLTYRGALSKRDLVEIKRQDVRREGLGYFTKWARKRIVWEIDKIKRRRKGIAEAANDQFHDHAIADAFNRAVVRYRLGSYDGPVTLYRPRPKVTYTLADGRQLDHYRHLILADNGWSVHAPQINVIEVPGDHDSMVLEPNMRVLADHMRKEIARADKPIARRLHAAE